jgi:hypothetical protein
MANTYTLIQAQTLASSAATVTFSSIPATYTDLVLRWSARTDRANTIDNIRIQYNGITTATYSETRLQGDGSAAASARQSAITYNDFAISDGDTATANTYASGELYIPSYTASQNKPISFFGAEEENGAAAYMRASAYLWSNTATINEVKLFLASTYQFKATSSFYLYGIRSS